LYYDTRTDLSRCACGTFIGIVAVSSRHHRRFDSAFVAAVLYGGIRVPDSEGGKGGSEGFVNDVMTLQKKKTYGNCCN
jgi:hypothetical protein